MEAIEIGAALRNQSFFHDVNYEPVFLDSPDELYAFREMTNSPKEDDISEKFSRESSSGNTLSLIRMCDIFKPLI